MIKKNVFFVGAKSQRRMVLIQASNCTNAILVVVGFWMRNE
jgi:hypothetical protein